MKEINLSSTDLHDLAAEILARGNRLRFRAKGSSMTPIIRHNDLVEVEPIAPGTIALGDILLLRDEHDRLLLHRVIGRVTGTGRHHLVSQGDALPSPDAAVSADRVLGRVVALTRRGRHINLRTARHRLLGRLWANASRHGRRLLLDTGTSDVIHAG